METIRIGKEERKYKIKSIRPMSSNVMQVILTSAIPIVWGDITIYTEDGTEATTLTGFDTVYRDDGQTVYLDRKSSCRERV